MSIDAGKGASTSPTRKSTATDGGAGGGRGGRGGGGGGGGAVKGVRAGWDLEEKSFAGDMRGLRVVCVRSSGQVYFFFFPPCKKIVLPHPSHPASPA